MSRIRRLFEPSTAYQPVDTIVPDQEDEDDGSSQTLEETQERPFSWIEYYIFLLLGIAMLWAYNMFLAAAPYFQSRFREDTWILNHFQAAEISVTCATNLVIMLILSKLQKNASYPKRIASALVINAVAFTILALSTFVQSTAGIYFGFFLITILAASVATALIQNGLFAFASGFGRGEYTQAIMTGQSVAGVLPPLTQIISVLVIPKPGKSAEAVSESHTSAFIYFITATIISAVALFAFFYLLRRKAPTIPSNHTKTDQNNGNENESVHSILHQSPTSERASVGLWTLFRKIPFLAAGVFICFAVTMVGFPVFTASIFSVSKIDNAIFIPLAFLIWNVGDLLGRLITLSPKISLIHYPFALFCISMVRFIFIPLYFLCNIKGRGAIVSSDFFYLFIVQFLYGVSNGYLGSECMMGAGEWVNAEEKEATGGFMGLMLVGGLTVGSLASFSFGDV